jgi:hypothetical protein
VPATRPSPGPIAASAFRLGLVAGGLAGLVGIAVLYQFGTLSPAVAGYFLLVLFPIYLVIVASVLSYWLGYDKDGSSLRPVYRS